jgi:hypothetical protein
MLLLRAKIQPYCSFTINLGPQYVERVFDSLLTKEGVHDVLRMNAAERLEGYLQLLHRESRRSTRDQYAFRQFYTGHFFQQLAAQPGQQTQSHHWQEKAICHYEIYLELADDLAESRFYAQWQYALLQDEVGYPWRDVETALLKAASFDPLRGEPLKKLLDHYHEINAWKKADSLRAIAVKTFCGKNPAAVRRWYVDDSAYDANLLGNRARFFGSIDSLHQADGQANFYNQ